MVEMAWNKIFNDEINHVQVLMCTWEPERKPFKQTYVIVTGGLEYKYSRKTGAFHHPHTN